MKNKIQFILVLVLLSFCSMANPLDSLRLDQKNGKKYIIHRVKVKETVSSLASYYQVEELAIMEANPLITEGVKRGMVVRIPLNIERYGNIEIKPLVPLFDITANKAPIETITIKKEDRPIVNSTPSPDTKQEPKQAVKADEPKPEITKVQNPTVVMPGKMLKEINKDGIRKIFYKVGNGETLKDIALKFNTTEKSIASTNMISSGSVTGGQIIKIETEETKPQIVEAPKNEIKDIKVEKEPKNPIKETYTEAKSAVNELVKKDNKPIVPQTSNNTDNINNSKFVVKIIANKKYILHTTNSDKETYELLAKKYLVSVKNIRESNNLRGSKLRNKQLVKIPVTDEILAQLNGNTKDKYVANKSNNKQDNSTNTYQTRSSVNDSSRFNWGDIITVKEEDISFLKKKSDDEAKLMVLNDVHANGGGSTEEKYSHPVLKGETIESIAKKYSISVSDLANWNGLWDHRVREGMELIVNAKRARKPYYALNSISSEQVKTIKSHDNSSLVEDINEKGLCHYNDDSKFIGVLHKTAPVGTLIMIENTDNFKKRFFTTTGVLKDTNNVDIIIQIDNQVAKELDINNPFTNVKLRFGLVQ